MPGKRDQASHDASIAKLADALPHSNVIRAHLQEVLNAAAFKGSRRSQEFLKHVVECALGGQWERLKERSLGIDVFSRDPSYDTGGDSIVRVTASDVRKRLLQYYSECPGMHAFRIEIPTGSYIPEFRGLEESEVAALVPGEAADTPLRVFIDSGSAIRRRARNAALSLLAVCFGWVLGLMSARFISGFSVKVDSRYAFYRELLSPITTDLANETEIALSGITETIPAFNLSQLMRSLGRSPRLTESRFLNWGAMRNVNLILLGAPQMSAWAPESLGRPNFTMEGEAITNARPLPGERKAYNLSVNGSILDDYGLIWMARSPSGSRLLLMAGLTTEGTAAVSDFFCDPDRMRPVYEKLRAASKNGSIVAEWQVLLHIHAPQNVPPQINFVSLRAGGLNQ